MDCQALPSATRSTGNHLFNKAISHLIIPAVDSGASRLRAGRDGREWMGRARPGPDVPSGGGVRHGGGGRWRRWVHCAARPRAAARRVRLVAGRANLLSLSDLRCRHRRTTPMAATPARQPAPQDGQTGREEYNRSVRVVVNNAPVSFGFVITENNTEN